MTLLASLRNRIFLTSALLAVLSIAAALYLVSGRVTREAENSLRREIASTREMVEHFRTTRTEMSTAMARLIADAPKLKAAVDTNDPPTVQDIASDYRRQLEPTLLLVTNRTGKVLALVGADATSAIVLATEPGIRSALGGRDAVSLLPQPNGILQLVTVPISLGLTQPDILGTLSVGFLFDLPLATHLKDITGSEIAFGSGGEILATTLSDDSRGELARLLDNDEGRVTLDAEEYGVLALSLSGSGEPVGAARPTALILRSRTDHLRFLQALHSELAVTAVVAVLLATLLSFAVARTITRPLAAITSVMRDVAATGDLTRKIVLPPGAGNDADARLLATTFNTLTDSVARFQQAMGQRERLASLGRLSTVIAHEIRNPLMIIKAVLHTLRQPHFGTQELREAVADIDDEVDRLNRIVNEVLDFARPIRFELGPVDLNALCRESATAAQVAPGAVVDLELDPELPHLTSDGERLRLALVNLLVNARQAVERRGIVALAAAGTAGAEPDGPGSVLGSLPLVTLSTYRHGGSAVISISDAGVGIDPADAPRIFDPYFTTKRGGTGLGLPIAKNIVEGLGGSIAVESALGTGTTIRIELPLPAPPERTS